MTKSITKKLIDHIAEKRDAEFFLSRIMHEISLNPFASKWEIIFHTGYEADEVLNEVENWERFLDEEKMFVNIQTFSIFHELQRITVTVSLTDEGNKIVESLRKY